MATLTSDFTVTNTTASNSGNDYTRHTNLAGGYFDSNAGGPGGDTAFDGNAAGGTCINPGVTLTLNGGAFVQAGSMKILLRETSETGSGGRLVLDGASLTANSLWTEGIPASTAPLNTADSSATNLAKFPTIEIKNGSTLTMNGSGSANYRAFIGNRGYGRLLVSGNSAILFNGNNVGGPGDQGTDPSNFFAGFQSEFSDCLIKGFNKIELLGAINRFERVTLEYTSNGEIVQDSGAIYLAGAPNIVAELNEHTLIVPSNIDLYPTSGNNYFKYATIREAACEMTLNGRVRIQRGTVSWAPRCHDFAFQNQAGATRDLSRRFRFNTDITTSVQTLDTGGAVVDGAGDSEAYFAIMDNRDILQVSLDTDDITNGSTGARTVNYYNMPQHAGVNSRNVSLAYFGWPTAKAAAAPGFADGSSNVYYQDDKGGVRAAALAFAESSDSTTMTLDSSSLQTNARLRQDLRRMYPFRAGFTQWGYVPEMVNSGLGSQAFLGVSGHGIANTTVNVGNAKIADNSVADIRDGKTLAISSSADPIMSGVSQSQADGRSATITNPTSATGNLTVTASAAVSLDHVYQKVAKWSFDNFSKDTDLYTATNPGSTNRDGQATSQTGTSTLSATDVLFFANAKPIRQLCFCRHGVVSHSVYEIWIYCWGCIPPCWWYRW